MWSRKGVPSGTAALLVSCTVCAGLAALVRPLVERVIVPLVESRLITPRVARRRQEWKSRAASPVQLTELDGARSAVTRRPRLVRPIMCLLRARVV
ncbi:hypothetical protein QMZ92_32250 [Streptomyces sp. HNM0645]|uniref:hypothetical protein n=1 Tax=Streptomyces sp. HNM0645 TaxID=2782343 RepID=UPI0024B7531F|nr:hypothetical protein [Streptomyces sp. HNM0645]MDI9888898.1 hypothetical protein [Streptomyces sp. HNM0645]